MDQPIEERVANKDEAIVERLCPWWRQGMLNAHSAIIKVAEFVAYPFTWVLNQFNGTADFKDKSPK